MLGVTFSVDETTMRFKDHHADKIRITYNAEGDRLQTYALYQKVNRYQIFMCKNSLSKKYLSKRLSLLDSRVMAIFDTVEEKHHQCATDNIIHSAIFFKSAYNHERFFMTHGVLRKGMRGIPPCIKHEKFKSKKAHIDTRGIAKTVVPKGDPKLNKIIEASVYDTEPVHYISMV